MKKNQKSIPGYHSYKGMIGRCYSKTNPKYYTYGARGIIVCDRWRKSFANFLQDMGEKPSKKHSLHRVNNDGNYSPENCIWALPQVQADNKTTTVYVTINGETRNLKQWSRFYKINYHTVLFRIHEMFMTPEDAVSTPLLKPFRRFYTINGITKNIKDWSREYKIPYQTLLHRVNMTGDIEKAVGKVSK